MLWLVLPAALLLALSLLVVYKLLRVPTEESHAKLFFNLFPKPRWTVKPLSDSSSRRRILLLTYGTRGDVQPLVLLARDLASEFDVAVCTCESFRAFVESEGVAFLSCGVSEVVQPAFLQSLQNFSDVMQVLADVYPKLATGMYYSSSHVFHPDLIISAALIRGVGAQCAEKLGIPHWVIHFAPSSTPTFEFPPPDFSSAHWPMTNKLLYAVRGFRIARAAVQTGLSISDENFRHVTLGLGSLSVGELVADIEREPNLHAYSPLLSPKPKDWSKWTIVCGALTQGEETTARQLEPSLLRFLISGHTPVVYVGLGSMENVEEMLTEIVEVLERHGGLKLIVSSHSSTMISTPTRMVIKEAPHMQLFAKVDVVVHHGGAGTTNAAVLCGTPQLIFPVLQWSDQPFWASTVERRGVGFACQRGEQEELGRKLERCLDPNMKAWAKEVQEMDHPDGRQAILSHVRSYFEVA